MLRAVLVCMFVTTALVAAREAKWFLRRDITVTRFISQQPVTSSCVDVEPTLKPCRHLRQLNISPVSQHPKIMMTALPQQGYIATPPLKGSIDARSWGSFFDPATVTVTQIISQRSLGPPALVTFSVRGCRPSRMPFDLPVCSINPTRAPMTTLSATRAVNNV